MEKTDSERDKKTDAEIDEMVPDIRGIIKMMLEKDAYRYVGQAFLQYRLQRRFLEGQNSFQRGQLNRTTWLVVATWFMAAGTWFLFAATVLLPLLRSKLGIH